MVMQGNLDFRQNTINGHHILNQLPMKLLFTIKSLKKDQRYLIKLQEENLQVLEFHPYIKKIKYYLIVQSIK